MESFSLNWQDIHIKAADLHSLSLDQSVFTTDERERFLSMRSQTRKTEFFATRKLLKEFLPSSTIRYTKDGKPFLYPPNGKSFSISHTKQFASIAFSDKKSNIAIDIEHISPRIMKIGSKFINDSESKCLSSVDQMTFATIIWSAKETMYKIQENGSLDFIKHYNIAPFTVMQEGEFTGIYRLADAEKTIQMKYWLKNNAVIVAGYE